MISVRRLPHVYPQDRWLFLTWHLHGSIRPYHFPPPHKTSAGRAFLWLDQQLDSARTGPMFLRQDAIANLVVQSLQRGAELGHYELASFVVMANHVHALLFPKVPPSRLLKSLKGGTAREANRLLHRTGEPFWQRESYDHWVRDEREWKRIAFYIENNPVRAGFVSRAEEYRWSSRWSQRSVDTSGERSRPGTSLAPLTVAAGNRQAELPISDSESISWQTVSNGWLVESVDAARRSACATPPDEHPLS